MTRWEKLGQADVAKPCADDRNIKQRSLHQLYARTTAIALIAAILFAVGRVGFRGHGWVARGDVAFGRFARAGYWRFGVMQGHRRVRGSIHHRRHCDCGHGVTDPVDEQGQHQ